MPIRLDGKQVAASIKADLARRVQVLHERGVHPGLGTLLVGEDAGSLKYVAGKHADCEEVGIVSLRCDLPADATQEQVMGEVRRFNDDPACTGFIVQLPLPQGHDEHEVIAAIDPRKDADGMHPYNLGELVLRSDGDVRTPLPCTPRGVIALLRAYGIPLAGKHVCVVGRGITIGRTIGLMLADRENNATVTNCHTGTPDLHEQMRRADVIVAAAGSAWMVKPEDVKPGAVLVDVGVSRVFDEAEGRYRVRGDVDPRCHELSSAYTPNPGGVGPMTRAMLLANVVDMAESSCGLR